MERLYKVTVERMIRVTVDAVAAESDAAAKSLAEQAVSARPGDYTEEYEDVEAVGVSMVDINDLHPDDGVITDAGDVDVSVLLSTSVLTSNDYLGADDRMLKACGIERE